MPTKVVYFSTVWLLHGWCYLKLLLSLCMVCVHHTSLICLFIQSCKVLVCLAVTCYLHFWQNDQELLHAAAVTQRWNGYWSKSQHRKLTLEKKIPPPLLPGIKPVTFWSQFQWSTTGHWAIPTLILHCYIKCKERRSNLPCFSVSALPPKSEEEVISNGAPGKKLAKGEEEKETKKSSSSSSSPSSKNTDVNEDDEIEYIEKSLPKKQPNVNQFDENTDSFSGEQQTKAYKATNGAVPVSGVSPSPSTGSGSSSSSTKAVSSKQLNSSKDNSAKKGKNYWKEQLPAAANFTNNKDEHISRWVLSTELTGVCWVPVGCVPVLMCGTSCCAAWMLLLLRLVTCLFLPPPPSPCHPQLLCFSHSCLYIGGTKNTCRTLVVYTHFSWWW